MHLDVSNEQTNLYWSKKLIIKTADFAKTSPRDNFFNISRFLHFANNVKQIKNDKIRKIRDTVDYLNDIFLSLYFR